jgi:sterol desaturase/sphingolipid hydroxylase (fatty acid hydroxylase superfamily)
MEVEPNAFETLARPAVFLLVFVAMALWEILAPRRPQGTHRSSRWPSNLGIVALNSVLVRAVFPMTAVAWAAAVAQQGFGLLNIVAMPAWPAAMAAFVLLDLAIYLQHRLFHAVPVFWRLHRMHHADTEIDVTNGLRFHPLEIVASMLLKFAVIAALGAPAWSVLVFEIVLNATSIFNHANIRFSGTVDRVLRRLVVTPDMHRVHHSVLPLETNSNFGFNLPWWDRWFGTYRAQPRDGHTAMRIGLPQFRDPKWLRLDRMLVQPWVKQDSDEV